jgi:hypothetical protein
VFATPEVSAVSDSQDFITSVNRFLAPVAVAQGLSQPAWIPREPGEVLALFKGAPFNLLVYCAGGHGVNMTVTVAPEANGWNPSSELGFSWLCRSLHLQPWLAQRYATSSDRESDIQELSRRLPEVMSAAVARGSTMWAELREYSRANAR